jgi:hypothetical protein
MMMMMMMMTIMLTRTRGWWLCATMPHKGIDWPADDMPMPKRQCPSFVCSTESLSARQLPHLHGRGPVEPPGEPALVAVEDAADKALRRVVDVRQALPQDLLHDDRVGGRTPQLLHERWREFVDLPVIRHVISAAEIDGRRGNTKSTERRERG